jgi:hypothetical protein
VRFDPLTTAVHIPEMSGGGYHLQGEPGDNPTTSIRIDTNIRCEKAPRGGPYGIPSVVHYYSGPPMHFLPAWIRIPRFAIHAQRAARVPLPLGNNPPAPQLHAHRRGNRADGHAGTGDQRFQHHVRGAVAADRSTLYRRRTLLIPKLAVNSSNSENGRTGRNHCSGLAPPDPASQSGPARRGSGGRPLAPPAEFRYSVP